MPFDFSRATVCGISPRGGVLVAVSMERQPRPADERTLTGWLALRRQAPPVGGCPTSSDADLQPSALATAWLRCPRWWRTAA